MTISDKFATTTGMEEYDNRGGINAFAVQVRFQATDFATTSGASVPSNVSWTSLCLASNTGHQTDRVLQTDSNPSFCTNQRPYLHEHTHIKRTFIRAQHGRQSRHWRWRRSRRPRPLRTSRILAVQKEEATGTRSIWKRATIQRLGRWRIQNTHGCSPRCGSLATIRSTSKRRRSASI